MWWNKQRTSFTTPIQMKEKLSIVIAVIAIAVTAFFMGRKAGEIITQTTRENDIKVFGRILQLAEVQHQYIVKTEALLDSINNWDETFMDTVMETDAYYEYEIAREKLLEECQKKNTTN